MKNKQILMIVVVLMNVFLLMSIVSGQETPTTTEPPHWTYEGEEGPDHWGELDPSFALCSDGRSQSPINISNPLASDLVDITFAYQPSAMSIFNNGHTIQVNYDEGSSITYNKLTYQLAQFHFHHPSEHTVDGETFPMELHLVHRNQSGALAVVGVLLRIGEADNPAFADLFNHLPTEKGEPDAMGLSIDANSLLPESRTYFTYRGSLTTPPCSQNVRWLVLTEPVEISEAQIEQFATIFELNARPVQPLNDRDLLQDTTMGG